MKKRVILLSVPFLFYAYSFGGIIGGLVDVVNKPLSFMTSDDYVRAKKLTLTAFIGYLWWHNTTLKRDVNRLIDTGKQMVANKPKSKKAKIRQFKRHLKEWQKSEE